MNENNNHRQSATAALEAEVGRLREAARNVLSHRLGEQPRTGYLRDNDASRTALTELALALAYQETTDE